MKIKISISDIPRFSRFKYSPVIFQCYQIYWEGLYCQKTSLTYPPFASTKPGKWTVMYLCVRGIDLTSFYDFSIEFLNCVVFCVFHFILRYVIIIWSIFTCILSCSIFKTFPWPTLLQITPVYLYRA